jgi:hypothetical protein
MGQFAKEIKQKLIISTSKHADGGIGFMKLNGIFIVHYYVNENCPLKISIFRATLALLTRVS